MFFAVFVWGAFAVLCAVLAPGRNRDPVGWLLLGLLFGIFALVALLAMPPGAPSADAADEEPAADRPRSIQPGVLVRPALLTPSAGTKSCPDCAETVKRAALVCRFCGYRFDHKPSAGTAALAPRRHSGPPDSARPYDEATDGIGSAEWTHAGRLVRSLDDGSIAAETATGWRRFASIEEFEAYIT